MEREKIKLNNNEWRDLALEGYLEDADGVEIPTETVEEGYAGSRRHTENHYIVFKRLSDGKFFHLDYETSVKDEMGWSECNYGSTEAFEVFPESVTTIKYK